MKIIIGLVWLVPLLRSLGRYEIMITFHQYLVLRDVRPVDYLSNVQGQVRGLL